MNKIVAFIPVRGGSKSIPGKNIKEIAGKPLVYWTAKAASDCPLIDCVYIATDDPLIETAVRNLGIPKVEVIGRSPETATDTATTESALLEFAKNTECEKIILIQATSPLLSAEDLRAGLEWQERSASDSLLSVVEQKRFIWSQGANRIGVPENYDPMNRPRRQDFNGYLVENGAFYIMTRDGLIKSRNRLHGKISVWKMPESSFLELDEPSDWEYVALELQKRKFKELGIKEKLSKIKLVITDVDGVLTDTGMYYTEKGDELKKFNTRDGKGFELLRGAGIQTGIITSENTSLVARRARKLNIDHLYQGAVNKIPAYEEVLAKTCFREEEILYLGDDLADIPVLKRVGLSACPHDAVGSVREICTYVASCRGGGGVFRELVDMVLSTKH